MQVNMDIFILPWNHAKYATETQTKTQVNNMNHQSSFSLWRIVKMQTEHTS